LLVLFAGCGARSALWDAAPAASEGGEGGAAAVPRLACRFDGPEPAVRVALAVSAGTDVVFVMTDGSTTTPYRFEPAVPGPARASFSQGIDQSSGYVVAHYSWWGSPDGTLSTCVQRNGVVCPEDDSVALLDPAGHVLWEKRFSGQAPSSNIGIFARTGEGGYALLSGASTPGTLLVAPDGSESQLPADWAAFEAPLAGPTLPVFAQLTRDVFGWWRPGAPVAPTDFSIQGAPYVFGPGTELAFPATAGDGTPVIVHARPDRLQTLATQADVSHGGAPSSAGAWRAYDLGSAMARFSVSTGESSQFSVSLPDGMTRFDPAPAPPPPWSETASSFPASPTPSTGIDHDGAFLAVFRNDYLAQAFRSADAASWTPIGKTLGQVERVLVGEVAGTYLVDTRADSFVPQQPWQTAPAGRGPELLKESHQIVRPADGVASVVQLGFNEQVHLSRDGLCAAYWDASSTLIVHDVARGSTFPVRVPAATDHALVWIE
jgi:hypothetical protein